MQQRLYIQKHDEMSWKNKYYELKLLTERELREQYNRLTKEALGKALLNTDEKFSKTNEFREQQKDLISSKANISDLINIENKIDTNDKNMREFISNEVVKRVAALERISTEKIGKDKGYAQLIALIFLAIAVLGFLFKYVLLKP